MEIITLYSGILLSSKKKKKNNTLHAFIMKEKLFKLTGNRISVT